MKASQYEREFCEYAENERFHAERVAGSGVRKKSVCDVVLIKDGQGYLVEVKSTRDKTYYISDKPNTRERLNELIEAAKKSGAIALLAVRFKRKGKKKNWVIKKLSSKLDKVPSNGKSLF
jgi:Holliday junction resolvase